MTVEELVLEKLRELHPHQKQQVLKYIQNLLRESREGKSLVSLEGLWAGDGFDITEEDIAEARREMWGGNSPKDIP